MTGERKERRGFASMSPEKQREIASKGGRAAHQKGTAHEWTSEEARSAGRKGGQISRGGRGRLVDSDTTARVFLDIGSIVGFQHEYAVTSIDTLISVNADIAESPIDSSEIVRLTPATPPATNLESVVVVPNPYKGSAEWDPGPNDRRMSFRNVPAGATIRIWTAAGELLRSLVQNPNVNPGGQSGELAWDLKNDAGRTVVSGIYIYSVHPVDGRTPKKGHFVIIK